MAGYRLTATADRRLADIYAYSILNFGRQQAKAYFLGIHEAFRSIVDHPEMGSVVEGRSLVRRLVHRRNSVFYRIEPAGILILDILGAGQDPERHLPDR